MNEPVTPEDMEREAGRLLVAAAKARLERGGPHDAHEVRHLQAAIEWGNTDDEEPNGANCKIDRWRLREYDARDTLGEVFDALKDAMRKTDGANFEYGQALAAPVEKVVELIQGQKPRFPAKPGDANVEWPVEKVVDGEH